MAHRTAPSATPDEASGPTRLILTLALVVLGLSIVVVRNLALTQKALHRLAATTGISTRPRTVDECLHTVIAMRRDCEGMASMCDAAVPRWMEACLATEPRRAYCRQVGRRSRSTRFGVATCRDLSHGRSEKKACAVAFRVIDSYCASIDASTGENS